MILEVKMSDVYIEKKTNGYVIMQNLWSGQNDKKPRKIYCYDLKKLCKTVEDIFKEMNANN
jgi:hypothetical protein